jgi:DNA-binding beta-propeller fold protein YncE
MLNRFIITVLFLIGISSAQTANPTILVLLKFKNELAFIDVATKRIITTVPVGEGPHEITLSGDGRKAYVANYGAQTPGSTVSIIDVSARKELKRLDLSPLRRPHGLFAVRDKVYVTTEVNRVVARIDTGKDEIDWLIGTGQPINHMVTGPKDGSALFTANIASNTVTRIDVARATGPAADGVTTAATGKQPEAIAISPDGTEVWVGANGEGTLTIFDAKTLAKKYTLSGHKVPIRITFTSDGQRVLVSDPEASEITIYDTASRKELKRLRVDGTPIGTVITKDGKTAYVASMQAGKIAVIDLTSQTLKAYINAPGGPDGITLAE